jgi:hypothetical protein
MWVFLFRAHDRALLTNGGVKVDVSINFGILPSSLQPFVTEDDNYYTNLALHRLQQRIEKFTPPSDAQFSYFPSGRHCHSPITNEQLLDRMTKFMAEHSPSGVKVAAEVAAPMVTTKH